MATIVNSFALAGVEGYLVEVETKTISGKPSVSIVGLGDTAVKEASERLQASLSESGFDFPKMKTVINLAPGSIKKSGSHFDLPMALGLLYQSEQITVADGRQLHEYGFIGELSLNGTIKPCRGVMPMVETARNVGIKRIIVPQKNVKEAQLVKGVTVYGFTTLKDVVLYLSGEQEYEPLPERANETGKRDNNQNGSDFIDVVGQDALMQFIVVAAAGGHNMLLE